MDHKKLIEAALFVSSRPLTLNDIGKITGLNSLGYVKELVEELQKEYEGRGIDIAATPEGFSMEVRPEYVGAISHLAPHADIPEGSKRTLALVLYKEPAKQSEIIRIQGSKAYAYIRDLEKRGFLKSEKAGRTKILKLTQEFERYFGEDKEKIRASLQVVSKQQEQPPKQ